MGVLPEQTPHCGVKHVKGRHFTRKITPYMEFPFGHSTYINYLFRESVKITRMKYKYYYIFTNNI